MVFLMKWPVVYPILMCIQQYNELNVAEVNTMIQQNCVVNATFLIRKLKRWNSQFTRLFMFTDGHGDHQSSVVTDRMTSPVQASAADPSRCSDPLWPRRRGSVGAFGVASSGMEWYQETGWDGKLKYIQVDKSDSNDRLSSYMIKTTGTLGTDDLQWSTAELVIQINLCLFIYSNQSHGAAV